MPARVENGATKPASSRFELPALNLNFGSITDGTNIPPPPDSPVEKPVEKPAQPPKVPTKDQEASKDAGATEKPALETAAVAKAGANGNLAGTKRSADDVPPSPTMSSRPGSLRRLLSRTLLNNSYTEGTVSNGNGAANVSRPVSRSGVSFMDERKAKRSSGWFRRLRGGDQKRSSLMFEQQHPTNSAATTSSPPPPPMIPELKDLEKDDGSLGGDLFKNIK